MTTTLSQRFGSEVDELVLCDADIITTVEFDRLGGEHLASGDRGGRIVVFDRVQAGSPFVSDRRDSDLESTDVRSGRREWKPYCQFKSHDSEFDYLKSLEIEEKINQIRFLRQVINKTCHNNSR